MKEYPTCKFKSIKKNKKQINLWNAQTNSISRKYNTLGIQNYLEKIDIQLNNFQTDIKRKNKDKKKQKMKKERLMHVLCNTQPIECTAPLGQGATVGLFSNAEIVYLVEPPVNVQRNKSRLR